jgi:membrane protein
MAAQRVAVLWFRSFRKRIERAPVLGVVIATQRRFRADRGGMLARTITYNAFLSIFPLILLGLAAIGFLLTDPAQRAHWADRLSGSVPGLRPLIGDSITTVAGDRAAVGIVALVTLAWTGTGVVRSAGSALCMIHDVPASRGVRALGWALVSLGTLGTLALASIALGGALSGVADGNVPILVVAAVVSLALDFALFLLAYRLLTRRRGPPLRALWPGAAVTAAGWTALKAAGVWYATNAAARAEAVYGAFAAAVGVLVLLALVSRVFVYGAELNAVLVERGYDAGEQKAVNLARHRAMRRTGT